MSYRNQPQGTYHETHANPEVYKDEEQKSARDLLLEFDAFLREHSAFDNFYNVFRDSDTICPVSSITDEPESFLSASFSWKSTPQGVSYWWEIDEEWYRHLGDKPELFNVIPGSDNTRAMAERGAEIINKALDFIVSSKSPQVATWAAANALGAACCEGKSCSDRAAMLNITPQALSKQTREFADAIGIEPVYGYDKH